MLNFILLIFVRSFYVCFKEQYKMDIHKKYALKVATLDRTYDIGLMPSELKQVVASCSRQKIDYKTEEEWLAAVDSMVTSLRSDPLQHEIKKQVQAVSQMCPVCGKQAEPITLMRDRKAYYCKIHRAVTPAIVDEK